MGYDRDLSFQYYNPTKIVFGENSVNDVGMEVEALGGSKALVVTDKSIKELGLAERVEKALGKRYAGTYDGCIVDSGVHTVNEGAAYARELGADAVVSVGGGSVIDTAKGIAILIREGGQLLDYCGLQMLRRPVAPHVAIPTLRERVAK